MTTAFEREMNELASVVEELEDTLDVQDVEDLGELSESMYEGLATIKETHEQMHAALPVILKCARRLTSFLSLHTGFAPSCEFPWCQENSCCY